MLVEALCLWGFVRFFFSPYFPFPCPWYLSRWEPSMSPQMGVELKLGEEEREGIREEKVGSPDLKVQVRAKDD